MVPASMAGQMRIRPRPVAAVQPAPPQERWLTVFRMRGRFSVCPSSAANHAGAAGGTLPCRVPCGAGRQNWPASARRARPWLVQPGIAGVDPGCCPRFHRAAAAGRTSWVNRIERVGPAHMIAEVLPSPLLSARRNLTSGAATALQLGGKMVSGRVTYSVASASVSTQIWLMRLSSPTLIPTNLPVICGSRP